MIVCSFGGEEDEEQVSFLAIPEYVKIKLTDQVL